MTQHGSPKGTSCSCSEAFSEFTCELEGLCICTCAFVAYFPRNEEVEKKKQTNIFIPLALLSTIKASVRQSRGNKMVSLCGYIIYLMQIQHDRNDQDVLTANLWSK